MIHSLSPSLSLSLSLSLSHSLSLSLSLLPLTDLIEHLEAVMLALVVLFTIFVGLVGLLAAIGECQKRRRGSAEKKRESAGRERLARVKGWLTGRGLDVPSVGQIISLLNGSLQQAPSKVRVV